MKTLLVSVLVAGAAFFVSCDAFSDPPVQSIPPGDDKIVPLATGEKSPFSGQLFDTPTALRWANWLTQYKARLQLDVESQKRVDQIEIDLLKSKLELERGQYREVTYDYQRQIAELQVELRDQPWYKSPWFGFGMGVAASVVLVGTAAYVIHETK